MSAGAIPLCPNCHKAGWHYVAPRLAASGYYACPAPEPTPPDPHQLDALPDVLRLIPPTTEPTDGQ